MKRARARAHAGIPVSIPIASPRRHYDDEDRGVEESGPRRHREILASCESREFHEGPELMNIVAAKGDNEISARCLRVAVVGLFRRERAT